MLPHTAFGLIPEILLKHYWVTKYVTGKALPDRFTSKSQLSTGRPELDRLTESTQYERFYYVLGEKKIMTRFREY
jgi:hypothetical protein